MRRRKVLVKRLVCIEDLGDVDMLFTDKTGTLTEGSIDYVRAIPAGDEGAGAVLRWGLLCTENTTADGQAVGGNSLDEALWRSADASDQRTAPTGQTRVGVLPFDHERRMSSALRRLAGLGITVKVVTGDNPAVAVKVCRDLGLGDGGALTGADLDDLDDARLATAIADTTVFARAWPAV